MSSPSLLLEIGMEELPPKSLQTLEKAFAQGIEKSLKARQFDYGAVQSFATPRRLAVLISDCNAQQPDQLVERKGPSLAAAYQADGTTSKALAGFMRSCGVEDASDLTQIQTDKGTWLAYRQLKPGASLAAEMPAILFETVEQLPIAKRMRWQNRRDEFVRPVRWLTVLHGDEVLACELFGQVAGRDTYGHRSMTDGEAISLETADQYETVLHSAFVIANFEARRNRIDSQLHEAARDLSGQLTNDPSLLDEVSALCEWPEVLSGQFDTAFLSVPEEALISAMREHQRYFHLRDDRGQLKSNFLTVANIVSRDPATVIAGNERVIHPRLADAKFFYDKDLNRSLGDAQKQLDLVIFQHSLGSYGDKTARVAGLTAFIAESLGQETQAPIRAAQLAKADLVSNMVGEFPELQGIMGRYYALSEGEPEAVANAIRDHYLPRFSGDVLPESPVSYILALADRLDTLVGLFSIGQPPSGSKDPFALRRQTLAIVRICIETPISLPLDALLAEAARPFDSDFDVSLVKTYLLDRFENLLTDQGAQWDTVRAIRGRASGVTDLYAAAQDIKTLDQFRSNQASSIVIASQKRVQNIIEKSADVPTRPVLAEQFCEDAERTLWQWIETLIASESASLESRLSLVISGATALENYFDDVMVNTEDPNLRENRLNTLRQLNKALTELAAFNVLQTSEA